MGRLQKQNEEENQKSFITATDIGSDLKALKTLEDFAKMLKSGEHLGLPGEIVVKLLELIQKSAASGKENVSANKAIRELEKELSTQRDRNKMLEKELNGLKQAYEDVSKKLQEASKQEDLKARITELEEGMKSKDLQMVKTTQTYQQQIEELNKKLQNSEKLREQSNATSKEFERKLNLYEEQIETLKSTVQQSELRHTDEMQKLGASESKSKLELNEMKSKISELNSKIEELKKENEELKNKLTEEQQKNQKAAHSTSNQNPEYYMNLIKELEKSYSDKLWQLRGNSDKLEKEVCNRKRIVL